MLTAYIIGFVLVNIVLGVLYEKEVIDWKPSGGHRRTSSDDMPHMVVALFWPMAGAIAAVVFSIWGLYKLFIIVSKKIAKVKFPKVRIERKE